MLAGCLEGSDVDAPLADGGAVGGSGGDRGDAISEPADMSVGTDAEPALDGSMPDGDFPDASLSDAGDADVGVELDADTPDAEPPDEGMDDGLPVYPESPTEVAGGPAFEPEVEAVWPAPMEQVFTLPEQRLLVLDAEGPLVLSPTLEAAPVIDGAAAAERLGGEADLVDRMWAVLPVFGGVLVSTDTGLMALDGGALQRSPLDALLPGAPEAMTVTEDGSVWMRHDDVARRWFEGTLEALWLEGRRLVARQMVRGPEGDVWVAAVADDGARLLRLWVEEQGLRALAGPPAINPEALAADGDGGLWALSGGDLWQRHPDGRWSWWRLPEPVEALWGTVSAGDLWVSTEDGLWHHRAGVFRPVSGAPQISPEGSTLEADGAVVYSDPRGLWRLRPERRVIIVGFPDGGTLQQPRPLNIRPDRPDQVTDVTFEITEGGRPVLDGPVEGPPWALTLDPGSLPEGALVLGVQVDYDDGQRLNASLEFDVLDVGPPTWVDDVAPIFFARCAGACHGDSGNARPLHTPALWQQDAVAILDAIRTGRMPLPPNPPVPPAEITLIEAWMESGFME